VRRPARRNDRPQPSTAVRRRRVLLTVVFLRQVSPQKVSCDLLGINPVTIGQAIKAPRQLLDEQKISITPTVVVRCFT
jgi:hypothetical protein